MLARISLALFVFSLFCLQAQAQVQTRTRSEIPHGESWVIIEADRQERAPEDVWIAEGNVVITYRDMRLTADRAEYHRPQKRFIARGNVTFSQGFQRFSGSRAEYNIDSETGKFYDVSGFTDREFFVKSPEIEKLGKDLYRVERGFITACKEAAPKWSFTTSKARIRTDRSAVIRHTVFRIKGVPVFYFPVLRLPLERKERASGFVTPSTSTSTAKGRSISGGLYLVLGQSADAVIFGDYFSKRGPGYGLKFRARPDENTRIDLASYFVNDRLGDGGGSFTAGAETYFKNGFRGVANANIVSNFRFRQVFSDSFRSATNVFENSQVFLTNNFDAFSLNMLLQRQETFFPYRSVVVRSAPAFNFKSLGKRWGQLPFLFFLDASIEGLNRSDNRPRPRAEGEERVDFETPELVQRFDLFPRLSVPLRGPAGIKLTPSLGVRSTFYSDSLAEDDQTRISSRSITRNYFTFELAARGPTLAKVYLDDAGRGRFKHLIEPEFTYRRIAGIDEVGRIIRFDDKDAIADTNELEYAITNRILTRQVGSGGETTTREFISFKLAQKYFFDPTFGGALKPGQANQFYPINDLTAFTFGGAMRKASPLIAQVRVSPRPHYSTDFRADYDASAGAWRNARLTAMVQSQKLFLASTYFVTRSLKREDAIEPGTFASNQFQSQVGYGNPLRGLATSFTISFDIHNGALLNSVGRVHYNWDCCGIAVEFQQFNVGPRVETQFRFSFSLKGIGSFGTIRHPENLF